MDLKAYYELAFGATSGQIYGSAEGWSVIQRSGHFRRMHLLDLMTIAGIDEAVAVDFGMGSWGFASVFPKLRSARTCIGIDISEMALRQSSAVDQDIRHKSQYLHSDSSEIPLPGNSVDIFWGGEVLEHVAEPRQFLQDIARVCRDGAEVILSTPNRDAVLYHIDGQHYAIGPEHIALLNAEELLALTELFFDTRSLAGYETSISPEVDRGLLDAQVAELFQERSTAFPMLASGMLYRGVANRAKYDRNARLWSRSDIEWSNALAHYSQLPLEMPLSAPLTGAGLALGSTVDMSCRASKYVLFFWAHDWSGVAAITIGDRIAELDLYSKQSGFRRFEMDFGNVETRRVRIHRVGHRSDRSVDTQVIFHSIVLLEYEPSIAENPVVQTSIEAARSPSVDSAIDFAGFGKIIDIEFEGLQFAIEIQRGIDRFISVDIERNKVWESFETSVFKALCLPAGVVIDIGANIGWYSLVASQCVGEGGLVLSIEPDRENFALLKRNLSRNHANNVVAHQVAVADRAGIGALFMSDENMGDHRLFEGIEKRYSQSVELIRLDTLVQNAGRRPALIKSDTQGSEWDIIKGLDRQTIDDSTCCWLIEFWPHGLNGMGSDPEQLLRWFDERSYQFFEVSELNPKLVRTTTADLLHRANTDLSKDSLGFINLLLIHPGDERNERIRRFIA